MSGGVNGRDPGGASLMRVRRDNIRHVTEHPGDYDGIALRRFIFLALAALMLVPGTPPALALALGAGFALALGNPFPDMTARSAPLLLKACVIGLGLGMSFDMLRSAGAPALLATATVVLLTTVAGIQLGRLLGVQREAALLISVGTGVCGGSAIAAIGSATGARSESMGVALATVFLLNAVALYVFPAAGAALGLTEEQFGTWAALAIHDTSSVVGAATTYGATALAVATVVKLARALWIVPLTLVMTWQYRRRSADAPRGITAAQTSVPDRAGLWRTTGDAMPWFVILFALAVVVRSLLPDAADGSLDAVARAARTGLVLVLFLIGAGLSRTRLAQVGGRPFLLGILLWVAVATLSLGAVLRWPEALG